MGKISSILPGIHHWTAFHEGIGVDVSSYWVAPAAALIDPMLPDDGIEWFEARPPEVILLTNRHHFRHSARFVDAFGCPVLCHESGLHEFEEGPEVRPYRFDERVAQGITALEMGAICPDDAALHVEDDGGVLAFADAIVHAGGGRLGFVPDRYMDEPATVKRGVRESLRRHSERDFDSLLFAHGEPIVGGGKQALRAFLEEDAGT